MREGFSVSATIEALHFLIPCTICDEVVVKGDDCPSSGVDHSWWSSESGSTRPEEYLS